MRISNNNKDLSNKTLADLYGILQTMGEDSLLLDLSIALEEYSKSNLEKESDDKFKENIEYARKLIKDIQSNLDLADEIGELEWLSTKLDFQNQLIISCEDLLSVSKKLKLKGVKDV